MSSRILLIGRSGCGKTSLIQSIHNEALVHKKTQAAEYHFDFIDVPGEYLEVRAFYRALIMLTCEARAVAILHAADDVEGIYPGGLVRVFDKPVIGVVTKIDINNSDRDRAADVLREAGARQIFFTSAVNGEGMDDLRRCLDEMRT
ncbi:MAG: EutP/PduV family microcompartment system protein [Oscillospiraceae bacterium]|nr:EutP/PduV family microcompartment system protein [Oscillospiraceae bacterium]